MTETISSQDPRALSHIEKRRRTKLTALADEIRKAQHKVDLLRIERDGLIRDWHEDGMSVELLANAAGLTRQGAYDAIARVNAAETD
jgi:short-subunit dehydrogenase